MNVRDKCIQIYNNAIDKCIEIYSECKRQMYSNINVRDTYIQIYD